MTRPGRGLLNAILISLLTMPPIFAEKQILFYSQSPKLTVENLQLFTRHSGTQRRIILLTGYYDLLDAKTGQSVGSVSVPSVFHDKRKLIFRRTFAKQERADTHYLLHFEGINGYVIISLNGQEIYRGSRNFLPLSLQIPADHLTKAENVLEVAVQPWNGQSNQFPFWMPVNLPRIDNGISGVVYLEVAPEIYISHLTSSAQLSKDSTQLHGNITLQCLTSLKDGHLLEIRAYDTRGIFARHQITVTGDSSGSVYQIPFQFKIDRMEPWSLENPHLYSLSVVLKHNGQVIDVKSGELSVRTISRKEKMLLLNGEQILLNGINYIYQDPQGIGLVNRELILQDLQLIKSKGFNAVRIGFYPQSTIFYDLTDSLGLLCFQDLPFALLSNQILSDSSQSESIIKYAGEFLKIANRHPSLIGIGAGNFFSLPEVRENSELKKLRNIVSSHGHYIVYASSFLPHVFDAGFADLFCFEILERNYLESYLSLVQEQLPDNVPVFISGLSKAFSYRVDFSAITHDLKQITELYQRLNEAGWKNRLAGKFVMTYSDYFLETPALQAGPQNQFLLNTIGICDLNRKVKPDARFALQHKMRPLPADQQVSANQNTGSYLFIISGLLNFLIFLVIFRSLIEFRRNIYRAIRKPHGFFMDLQERRLITYGQSFFLMMIMSVNGAVMLGSMFFFFRNNFYVDYLLSLFLPNAALKLFASMVIWKPVMLIPLLTMLLMLIFILLAVPIQLVLFFREPRVRTRQAIAISSWAGAPFLILLPIGMFFHNLLLVMNSYWILIAVLLYFHVWYFIRWMTGTRVMTALSYARVFLYALFLFAIIGGGLFYYLQNKVSVLMHLDFLVHLFYYHI